MNTYYLAGHFKVEIEAESVNDAINKLENMTVGIDTGVDYAVEYDEYGRETEIF